MEELKRTTGIYVYYNKSFYITYTYYSLVNLNGDLYWRQWNIKLNIWVKLLKVACNGNHIKELNTYLSKHYLPFKY